MVEPGSSAEYARIKKLLDAGKHPTFIGRSIVECNARNGGLLFFKHDGLDVGVALVNPRLNTLLVLNVIQSHRGHGLGSAIVRFLQCNFVRAIETKVAYFQSLGYKSIGKLHKGRRFQTQVMVKAGLIGLAGRVGRLLKPKLDAGECAVANAKRVECRVEIVQRVESFPVGVVNRQVHPLNLGAGSDQHADMAAETDSMARRETVTLSP